MLTVPGYARRAEPEDAPPSRPSQSRLLTSRDRPGTVVRAAFITGRSAPIRSYCQRDAQPRRFGVPARRHVEAASLRPSRSVMTGRETMRTWRCWEDPELAGEAALPRTRALPGPGGLVAAGRGARSWGDGGAPGRRQRDRG